MRRVGRGRTLRPDQLVAHFAMEREAGSDRDIPDMPRNGDWSYAVFTVVRAPRFRVDQAECLARHKPQDVASDLFTLNGLAAVAKTK